MHTHTHVVHTQALTLARYIYMRLARAYIGTDRSVVYAYALHI